MHYMAVHGRLRPQAQCPPHPLQLYMEGEREGREDQFEDRATDHYYHTEPMTNNHIYSHIAIIW